MRCSLVATAAVALGLGCAGAAPTRRAPPAARPVAAATAAAEPTWIAVVLPPETSRPAREGLEPDGTEYFSGSGARIRVRGDEVRWAPEFTLAEIVGVARTGETWLFATGDGALFRAEGYLGPLTRLGGTDGVRLQTTYASRGALAAKDTAHGLWVATLQGGFRRVPAPADRPLLGAGFLDGSFGVAAVVPGALLRTTDGGASFQPVDLGARAAYNVLLENDTLVVDVTGSQLLVPRRDAPVAASARAVGFDFTASPAVLETIAAAARRENPLGYYRAVARGPVLADGRAAPVVDGQLELVGPEGPATQVPLPESDCTVRLWGSRMLAVCQPYEQPRDVFVLDEGRGWHAFPGGGPSSGTLLAASDGSTLLAVGACEGAEPPSDSMAAACFYDGFAWRPRALPADFEVLAVHGPTALLRARDGDARRFYLARLGDDEPSEPTEVVSGDVTPTDVEFAPDGSLVAVWRQRSRTLVAVAAVGAPLVARPLPDGGRAAAFANARRGVAAGANLGHVWSTLDGGRTWQPLAHGVLGDASGVRIDQDRYDQPRVACAARTCVVGRELVWTAPPTEGARAPRVWAATRAPAEDPGHGAGDFPAAMTWACNVARAGREGDSDRRDVPEIPAAVLPAPDGWVATGRPEAQLHDGGRIALTWGGVDARGRFRASARPATLPPPVPPAGANASFDRVALAARLVTRTLAVLDRCALAQSGQRVWCDVVVAASGAAPVVLDPAAQLHLGDAAYALFDALGLPDGGAVLDLRPVEDGDTQLDLVLALDARGRPGARRAFAWDEGTHARMVARSADDPGIVVARCAAPGVLEYYSLRATEPARVAGRLEAGALALCRGAPAATAVYARSALAERNDYAPRLRAGSEEYESDDVASLLELTPRASCIRAVSFRPASLDAEQDTDALAAVGGAFRLLPTPSGGLDGVAVTRTRELPLVCRAD